MIINGDLNSRIKKKTDTKDSWDIWRIYMNYTLYFSVCLYVYVSLSIYLSQADTHKISIQYLLWCIIISKSFGWAKLQQPRSPTIWSIYSLLDLHITLLPSSVMGAQCLPVMYTVVLPILKYIPSHTAVYFFSDPSLNWYTPIFL